MPGHKWEPITDLPEGWESLAVPSVHRFADLWTHRLARLRELGKQDEFASAFLAPLHRRWAIETGVVEGVYYIDRGTTEVLIAEGIRSDLMVRESTDRDPGEVALLVQDALDAIEGLFAFVRQERALSSSYVKELHQAILAHQETTVAEDPTGKRVEVSLIKGAWRTVPTRVRRQDGEFHEYCPLEHIASEMDRLIQMHLAHVDAGVPSDVEAAWLHHRFTQIHPFQDGNGRVARALATLVLLRAGWMPLVIDRDTRSEYTTTLETADGGELASLIGLFASLQEGLLKEAMQASDGLVPERDVLAPRLDALSQLASEGQEGGSEARTRVLDLAKGPLAAARRRRQDELLGEAARCLRPGYPTVAVESRALNLYAIHLLRPPRADVGGLPAAATEWIPDTWSMSRLVVAGQGVWFGSGFVEIASGRDRRVAAIAVCSPPSDRAEPPGQPKLLGHPLFLDAEAGDPEASVLAWLDRAFALFLDEWIRRL